MMLGRGLDALHLLNDQEQGEFPYITSDGNAADRASAEVERRLPG